MYRPYYKIDEIKKKKFVFLLPKGTGWIFLANTYGS